MIFKDVEILQSCVKITCSDASLEISEQCITLRS